jgi:arylsulfatase A-like enzyme
MSTRRRFIPRLVLVGLAVLLGLVLVPRFLPRDPAPTRAVKRVILITVDTLRRDALPFHGHPRVRAPHLTRLSRHAVVFDRAQATSPWTRPSVVSILTGLPPAIHGATHRRIEVETLLPESTRTLAECMREAGYRTAAIGYNPFIAASPNARRGFENWMFYGAPEPAADSPGTPAPAKPELKGDQTDALTTLAAGWVRDHAAEDFFLWLHYYDPHAPYTPRRADYAALVDYEPPRGEAFVTWTRWMNDAMCKLMYAQRGVLDKELTGPQVDGLIAAAREHKDRLRALYDAEVEHVDRAIGRLLARLEALGLYEDTLVVVTSDHGEEFLEHDRLEHGHTLYEELLLVPMMVKLPGATRGRRVPHRVSNQSLFPTILELAGQPLPPDREESPSLVPTMTGNGDANPPALVAADGILYGESGAAIVFGHTKYVYHPESGREELYDLSTDPAERSSLVRRDPETLARARAKYRAWRRSTVGLFKRIWSGRLRTTEENEHMREVLRSHGYLK